MGQKSHLKLQICKSEISRKCLLNLNSSKVGLKNALQNNKNLLQTYQFQSSFYIIINQKRNIMQNNDLKILYQKGINALHANNILQQREVLLEMKNKLSFEYSINVNLRLQKKNPNGQILPLANLTPNEVYANLYEYCQILYNKIHSDQPYPVSIFAINRLIPTKSGFNPMQILFKNQNQVLSVSDLLKAISYSLDFIHKITGKIDITSQGNRMLLQKL